MCYCNPSIRTPRCDRIDCIPKGLSVMDNVFEKYSEESEHERPIEINFPLGDKDILKILKGVEYNQILTVGAINEKPQRIHVRVFSSERVKNISWENWRKIVRACYSNPDLEQVIRDIESEV